MLKSLVNNNVLREQALETAGKIAQWYVSAVQKYAYESEKKGCFPFCILPDGRTEAAFQWNIAFGSMGLLSAEKCLGSDGRFLHTAEQMIDYLRKLQIPEEDPSGMGGAIREQLPSTPWCYVRDGLSGAWGFLEYYRVTGNDEFLERALCWARWFLKYGLDETGWPKWGVMLGPLPNGADHPQMCDDMHGCFHGGCLNFFYQLAMETGNDMWIGPFFRHIADYFCDVIQQKDGFFRTVDRHTGKIPVNDPQNGLHRINDDLGSLGLLCAFQVTHSRKYLDAVERYLVSAANTQQQDGHFENSCAAIPVVLNAMFEAENFLPVPAINAVQILCTLFERQFNKVEMPELFGGLDEQNDGILCVRSMGYALIVLLKLFGCDRRFLTCQFNSCGNTPLETVPTGSV